MAYVILKTKERRRRPMMQRLFMGLIVTMGVFFGYDYVFDQDIDVTLEPDIISSESIDYTLTITNIPDNVTSFLLVVEGSDYRHDIETNQPTISGRLTDLDANMAYTFTVYTISETSQTKVYETELITEEMANNE